MFEDETVARELLREISILAARLLAMLPDPPVRPREDEVFFRTTAR